MSDNTAGRMFLAHCLMTIGALMIVLCGGCTLFFLAGSLWAVASNPGHGSGRALGALPGFGVLVMIIGGLPTAAGVALFLAGRRMRRRVTVPHPRDLDSTFS
jgi:hypothetical protein